MSSITWSRWTRMRPAAISAGVWRLPMCQARRASASGAAVTSTQRLGGRLDGDEPAVGEDEGVAVVERDRLGQVDEEDGAAGGGQALAAQEAVAVVEDHPVGRPSAPRAAADGDGAQRLMAERQGDGLDRAATGDAEAAQVLERLVGMKTAAVRTRVRAGADRLRARPAASRRSSKLRIAGGVRRAAAERAELRRNSSPGSAPRRRRAGSRRAAPRSASPAAAARRAARAAARRAAVEAVAAALAAEEARASRTSSRPASAEAASNNKPLRMGAAADHALPDSRSRRAWEGQNARGGGGAPLDLGAASAYIEG